MRTRRSKFDPYKEQIRTWCLEGKPVREMADKLMEIDEGLSDEQAIHTYIRRHSLRNRPWQDVYDARNKCDECDHCHIYTNTNNTEGRICCLSWKTIQPNVFYSPKWCEK